MFALTGFKFRNELQRLLRKKSTPGRSHSQTARPLAGSSICEQLRLYSTQRLAKVFGPVTLVGGIYGRDHQQRSPVLEKQLLCPPQVVPVRINIVWTQQNKIPVDFFAGHPNGVSQS